MRFFKQRNHFFKTLFLAAAPLLLSSMTAEAKPGDGYSAGQAVTYADSCFKMVNGKYTANPSTKYGQELCAGYVSQCLREGGMSEDSSWYWKGIGKTPDAWRVSTALYSYLKNCGYSIIDSPNAEDVQTGDVIFYQTGSGWGHCAICVGKNSAGTPLINAYNNPHYHCSNWSLSYKKVCVVSMNSSTQAPEIQESTVESGKEITLSCAASDATIYYTTNGKTPTKKSTVYKKPFILKNSCEVKALAISKTKGNSKITSSYINIDRAISDGNYVIVPASDPEKALGISDTSEKENAAVQPVKKTESYQQKFTLSYIKDGYYTITSLYSGLALTEIKADNTAISLKKNSNVKVASVTYSIRQQKATDGKNQQWKLICTGKNKFTLQNAETSHYLTLEQALSSNEPAYPAEKNVKQIQEFTFTPTLKSEITLKNETTPDKLKLGSPFVIYGNLQSNYNLDSVEISIENAKKKTVASASDKPNSTTYSLFTLSPKIKFGKLSAGTYTYLVKAKDATGQAVTLVEKTFKVVK